MDEKTMRIMETFKKNPQAAQALFQTQDGQALLHMLTASDQGASLQHAAQNAEKGNPAEMIQMLSRVMKSKEGAELISRIQRSVRK